jgi:hypothetical protein
LADQDETSEATSEETAADVSDQTLDDVVEQLRTMNVGQFVLSSVSTLVSIGYAKLQAGELEEARGAIDAVRALLPVLEGRMEESLRRDFEQALANLQIAYADAAAGASA